MSYFTDVSNYFKGVFGKETIVGSTTPKRAWYGNNAYPTDTTLPVVYGTSRVTGRLIFAGYDYGKIPTAYVKEHWYSAPKVTEEWATPAIVAICEGPITGVVKVFRNGKETPFGKNRLCIGGTSSDASNGYRLGTANQTYWNWLDNEAVEKRLPYAYVAYLHTYGLVLPNKQVPTLDFVVKGICYEVGQDDANPATVLTDILTNTRYGLGLDPSVVDVTYGPDGLAASGYDRYCKANGFRVSATLESKDSALEAVKNLLESTNSMAVWTNGTLRVIPLGDSAITGNGVTYTPPSSAVGLTEDDFLVTDHTDDPIRVDRRDSESCFNVHPVSYLSRAFNYEERAVESMVTDSVDAEGIKRATAFQSGWIKTEVMAQAIASIRAQRDAAIRNVFNFKLGYKHAYLEPGDLVALTDAKLGISGLVCRIRSMEEDDNGFTIEAEERPSGAAVHVVETVQTTDGTASAIPSGQPESAVATEAFSLAGSSILPSRMWQFDNSDSGWTLTNYTGSSVENNTARRYTPSAADPSISVTGLTVAPATGFAVAIRYRLQDPGADMTWVGRLYYSNGSHGFSDSYYKEFVGAVTGEWVTTVVDMRTLTVGDDYMSGNVTGFKVAFASEDDVVMDVDWVAVGKFGTLSADLSNAIGGSVTSDLIADGAVLEDALADGSISAAKLMAESVGTDALATGAVVADKIAAGAIGADHIAAGAITAGNISAGELKTSNYAEDGSGNPTAGAKLDHTGSAIKVSAGNLQIGADTFTETQSVGYRSWGGSSAESYTAPSQNYFRVGDFSGSTGTTSFFKGTVAAGSRGRAVKVTRAGNYRVTAHVTCNPYTGGLIKTSIFVNESESSTYRRTGWGNATSNYDHAVETVWMGALAANDELEAAVYAMNGEVKYIGYGHLMVERLPD